VHRLFESDAIDRAVRVPVEIVDDLQDVGAAETLQRLREWRLQPDLSVPERAAYAALHVVRKGTQIVLAASDPANRPRLWLLSIDALRHATPSVYASTGISDNPEPLGEPRLDRLGSWPPSMSHRVDVARTLTRTPRSRAACPVGVGRHHGCTCRA